MTKIITLNNSLSVLFYLLLSTTSFADGFIKRDVYTFKSDNDSTVFTDKEPTTHTKFKTKTIESARSTANSGVSYRYRNQHHSIKFPGPNQTKRIIVEHKFSKRNSSKTKKSSLARCKYYKKRFTYFSNKMKAEYKNSQYE